MKYFISKIIPYRDRCWEAVTFKNKEINTCLQEGWKDYCGLLFWGGFFFYCMGSVGGGKGDQGAERGRGCIRT